MQFREDIQRHWSEISNVTDAIDRCWPYATGIPLFPGMLVGADEKLLPGWESNSEELLELLPYREPPALRLQAGLENWHWWRGYTFPLKQALEVLSFREMADEPMRCLMEYHYHALKTIHSDAGLLFLAKGLELARELLPGRTDLEKQRALAPEVQHSFKRSLHWLFGAANKRMDVRHVVKGRGSLVLHPRMTRQERRDFTYDADLVLRTVVTDKVGLEPLVMKNG